MCFFLVGNYPVSRLRERHAVSVTPRHLSGLSETGRTVRIETQSLCVLVDSGGRRVEGEPSVAQGADDFRTRNNVYDNNYTVPFDVVDYVMRDCRYRTDNQDVYVPSSSSSSSGVCSSRVHRSFSTQKYGTQKYGRIVISCVCVCEQNRPQHKCRPGQNVSFKTETSGVIRWNKKNVKILFSIK